MCVFCCLFWSLDIAGLIASLDVCVPWWFWSCHVLSFFACQMPLFEDVGLIVSVHTLYDGYTLAEIDLYCTFFCFCHRCPSFFLLHLFAPVSLFSFSELVELLQSLPGDSEKTTALFEVRQSRQINVVSNSKTPRPATYALLFPPGTSPEDRYIGNKIRNMPTHTVVMHTPPHG